MSRLSEKCDPDLGQRVNEHLTNLGINTPTIKLDLDDQTKVKLIEAHIASVLDILGLDASDDSLAETPTRIAKMFVQELFWGLSPNTFPKCTTVENKMGYDELIVERSSVKSTCEHHFVYFGTAHNPSELGCWVAYIPKKKVLGLSKLNRVVSYFSHRPQIQERLTQQIVETLMFILDTPDVACVMKGQHFCVLSRGVEDDASFTITSCLKGRFKEEPELRAELMSIVNNS